MESALVLCERGHKVTIYEKSDRLGGISFRQPLLYIKKKTENSSSGTEER
jgi:NADPH-dependent 2,4-dienoyl-CoA reductase/sulfur reductase-like enzyme